MADPASNGNGKSASGWVPAGATSGGVAVLLGSLGVMANESYSHDQAQIDSRVAVVEVQSRELLAVAAIVDGNAERIATLEAARVEDAYQRGRIDQTLVQLGALVGQLEDDAARISQEIVAKFGEFDDAIQREMRDLDAAMVAVMNEMDRRLQGELATHVASLNERISLMRTALDQMAGNRWTKEDHERFEDQLGVRRAVAP